MSEPLLELTGLARRFPMRNAWGVRTGWLRALDGVSLQIGRGEILGVVGESGCGKSTLGKTIAGIHAPSAGSIRFEGNEIAGLTPRAGAALRSRLQYCYQDPGASLDPRWKIGPALEEPLVVHTALSRAERKRRVHETLEAVGLPHAHLDLYPHEISGGQQRRVGLARVMMLRPSLIILDEPTSGLDVSVQATVLNLFAALSKAHDLAYMFISHDLSVVRLFSHRIAVMYLGRDRRDRRDRARSSPARSTPTPSRCWRRCRRSAGGASPIRSGSRASRRARTTCRRAVASRRAARARTTSAGATIRRAARWRMAG